MNTTIRAENGNASEAFWTDHAIVLRKDAAHGLLHGFAALHTGTFGDMVRLVRRLPEAEREELVIEKSGDRQYSAMEIAALARRADFPT